MKTLLICTLALGGLVGFSSCVSVEREPARQSTTTTEETTISRPAASSVETQTIRSY